jgi:hypothetical protein
MVNRRSFLRNLGLAVAGAAVASKIELLEKVIPVPASPLEAVFASYDAPIITAEPINFMMLEKAYRRACIGYAEPNLMILSRNEYALVNSLIQPHLRYTEETGMEDELGFSTLKFHHAALTYGILEESAHPKLKGYVFKQDKESPILIGIKKEIVDSKPNYKEFYSEFS